MYTLRIEGFKTKRQVEEFISWYEGQGEQDSCIWFEYRKEEGTLNASCMLVNYSKTYPIKFYGDEATMFLDIL